MMINLAAATLAVGLLAANPQAPKWESSYGKALEATRAGQSPLLVVLDNPGRREARVEPQLMSESSVSGKEAELLRPYRLCHVDVTTQYGQRVANAFGATRFPHVAIIDKTGSLVLYRKSGPIDAAEWERMLTRHQHGERSRAQAVSHTTSYRPIEPVIYANPGIGSYCPGCQRRSF